jgi:hypothetical protein
MDAQQYRDALSELGLTQAAAGELFEVGERSSRRWALGEAKVPPMVAFFLELMLSKRIKLELNIPAGAERTPVRQVWTFSAKQSVHTVE